MQKRTFPRPLAAAVALIGLALACTGLKGGKTPTAGDPTSTVEAAETRLALTVYNQGMALVRDRRSFNLQEGFNEIEFSDVAASIDPTSVLFQSLTDPGGVRILEQNYEYDLVNSSALFEKYLDQTVVVVTEDGSEYSGRLLSTKGGIILQDDDGQVNMISGNVQRVSFPDLPDGLITRPTLVWRLLAEQAGDQEMEVTYLTGGISWQADYVLLLSAQDDAIDLDGWVTLNNTSGTTYRDALLKLIAGDLQRLPEPGYAARDIIMEA